MGISQIYKSDTAEVGKGIVDSIVIPYETTIFTEYSNGFNISDQSRIIPSGMLVLKNGTFYAINFNENAYF